MPHGRPGARRSSETSHGILISTAVVGGVIYAVQRRDLRDIERIDSLEASEIEAVLFGIGAALMMGIDAANGAEVVFGCLGVELIQPQ